MVVSKRLVPPTGRDGERAEASGPDRGRPASWIRPGSRSDRGSAAADGPGRRGGAGVQHRRTAVLLGLGGRGGIAAATDRLPGLRVELVLAAVGAARIDGAGVPTRLAGGDGLQRAGGDGPARGRRVRTGGRRVRRRRGGRGGCGGGRGGGRALGGQALAAALGGQALASALGPQAL